MRHETDNDKRMSLESLKTILIDGDGVLWRSDEPIPGLSRFFDVLEQRSIDWALLTNNSTRTAEQYVEKVRGFGLQCSAEQIFSSGTATATYLRKHFKPGDGLYVVGAPGFKQTLAGAGFVVHDGEGEQSPPDIAAVVASIDRDLTYGKLKVATLLIRSGKPFIATNIDRTFPSPEGLVPGTGAVIAALTAATDVSPTVMGKPELPIFEAALKGLDAEPATTAVLGDRLETDILGGQRAGVTTIAVLTGITTRDELATSDIIPDYVFESIAELADALAPG